MWFSKKFQSTVLTLSYVWEVQKTIRGNKSGSFNNRPFKSLWQHRSQASIYKALLLRSFSRSKKYNFHLPKKLNATDQN